MNIEQLYQVSAFIVGVSLIIVIAIKLRKSPKFEPVKVLNLQPGVYQNKRTGNIIHVRAFKGNMACVADETGTWNVSYDVLDSQYYFIGVL